MTVQVGNIFDSVSITLLDTARRTWTLDELVLYLNEALAATAAAKPDMYPRQEFMTCAAGVTQTIPADGVSLLEVQFNEVSGRVVRQVDRDLLDEANRFWPAATQETDVWEYAADPRDPRRFAVTPPNDGTGSVQVLYGAVPDAVTGSSGETLPVSASFEPIFVEYLLYKCYGKNTKSQDMTKSIAHYQRWASLVGLKAQAQIAVAPKVAVAERS